MQEKGLLVPKRSRHRLTPGTVKFAAFHVLSLEGSKGLTVLDLADKIQVSECRILFEFSQLYHCFSMTLSFFPLFHQEIWS